MKKRFDAIDGLKVFATITVFLSHLGGILNTTDLGKELYSFFSSGAYGVNFFFVISGFMIYFHYYDRFSVLDKNSVLLYYKTKIRKLYPMYALTMSVFIFIGLRNSILQESFTQEYIKNFIIRIVISIPMLQTLSTKCAISQTFNAVAWFLSCLTIIYLIVPFAFYVLQRKLIKKILVVF